VRALAQSALILLLTTPVAAGAQGVSARIAGPAPSELLAAAPRGPLRQPLAADSARPIRPTHWKEGALVGGVAGGIGLALFADAFCRSVADSGPDCGGASTAGFLLGAVLGGLTGMLIGGQIPKDAP
jgi:uncharacterized protein YcfJ